MLVTQHGAGYNGILWDFMGKPWEMPDFCGIYVGIVAARSWDVLALWPCG
jgi:hypothetical protein